VRALARDEPHESGVPPAERIAPPATSRSTEKELARRDREILELGYLEHELLDHGRVLHGDDVLEISDEAGVGEVDRAVDESAAVDQDDLVVHLRIISAQHGDPVARDPVRR